MGRYAYITNRAYGGSGGTRHYQHVMRIKTQIKNPKPPKVYGNREYFEKLIDRDRNPPSHGNAKRDYYEYMAYVQKTEQIEEVRYIIAKRWKIDRRRVLAVYHEDEGTPHTHFMIAWRNPKGKSLHLGLGDIEYVRYSIAKILGRELPPKKKGKKIDREETKGVKYKWADMKLCNAISQMDKKMKGGPKEYVKQIAKVVHIYGSIDVYLLRRGVGRIRCCTIFEHNGDLMVAVYDPKTQEFSRFDTFKYSVLRYANLRKHNEITFAPSKSVILYEGKLHFSRPVLFIDDVPQHMLNTLPKNTLVVETSPGSYQAHIPLIAKINIGPLELDFSHSPVLDNAHSPDMWEYRKVPIHLLNRGVVSYFRGDVGSRDYYHLRKLPGFYNLKYEDAPLVEIKEVQKMGGYNELMNAVVKSIIEQSQYQNNFLPKLVDEAKKQNEKREKEKSDTKLLTWQYFYNRYRKKTPEGERVDLSRADMAYAIYLIAHGVDPNTAAQMLAIESENITLRKKGHLEDYVIRTVQKAVAYVDRKALDKAIEEDKLTDVDNYVKNEDKEQDYENEGMEM